jgi:hypothetical protein
MFFEVFAIGGDLCFEIGIRICLFVRGGVGGCDVEPVGWVRRNAP